MSDAIFSVQDFSADTQRWLARIRQEPGNLVLTEGGAATAVVLDYESYQAQQEAILLLKLLAQGEADIQAGRLTPQKEVFAELRKSLAESAPSND